MDRTQHPGLHLLPPAGGQRRPDRGQGEGGRAMTVQGRPLPLHRQRQGDRAGRARRPGQDGVRRQDRRTAGRAHGRRGSDRTDPGLRHRPDAGDDRGGADAHRLPAPDPVGDDARKRCWTPMAARCIFEVLIEDKYTFAL